MSVLCECVVEDGVIVYKGESNLEGETNVSNLKGDTYVNCRV